MAIARQPPAHSFRTGAVSGVCGEWSLRKKKHESGSRHSAQQVARNNARHCYQATGCRTSAVCFRAGPVKRHAALLRLLHRLRPQERNVAASGMKNSEVEWEPFSVSLSRLSLAGAPARSIVLLQA